MRNCKGTAMLGLLILLSVHIASVSGQAEGDVRLVGGPNAYEGRAEIFHDGVWLSLCARYMSGTVPQVICTQLGYQGSGTVTYYANSYGEAPGETYRSTISCSTTHTALSQCSVSATEQNCDPRYTLGVSCNAATSTTKIRLAAGPNQFEGRIEVFMNGVWGTVCRDLSVSYIHHVINAHVACRELFGPGYGGTYYPTHETPSRFGILRSGAIHVRSVRCNGDEDSLLECTHSTAWTYTSCYHEMDATVKCFPIPTGCVGYFNAETGSVTSPGYPQAHSFTDNTECVWKIQTKIGRNLNLTFPVIEDHSSNTGTGNYIKVVDSNGISTRRQSYGTPITDFISSENVAFIRQYTAAGDQGINFVASWSTEEIDCNATFNTLGGTRYYIRSVGYSGNYPTGLDCYYLVEFRDLYTASLLFYAFDLDDDNGANGECGDYLEIFDGDSVSDPSLGRYCNYTRPPTLTSTQNTVLLHFHSDDVSDDTSRGFYVRIDGIEPDPEITNLNGSSGTVASPGYPELYSNETDYVWVITVLPYQSVTLTFSDFATSCAYSSRLWIEDRYPSGRYIASPCGSGVPTPVLTNTNVMHLHLQSTPLAPTGNRFNAAWEAECRRTFTSSSYTFRSPESPNAYPENLDCVYIITLETGYYITLTFTSFSLDPDNGGVCSDHVKVRDGSSEFSPLILNEHCGTSLPSVVTSTSNSLWIKFRSDATSNPSSTGFVATYVSQIKECETQAMTSSEGSFSSPGFPLQYPRYTYCVWSITVPPQGIVELTFHHFAIGRQNNYDCAGAYVRIYDGNSVDADTVIDTLCGTTVVPKITSSGRSLTIVLNSFAASPDESIGFNASYTTISSADIDQYDLYPFGESEEDSVLDQSENALAKVTVQSGFPFGDHVEYDVYIANNGLVSIGNKYTWPDLPDDRQVICVYCAYIDNSDDVGGIYYQQYSQSDPADAGVLSKASQEVQEFTDSNDFQATLVLVVTWDRVRQGRYRAVNFDPDIDEGEATFQLALISNGVTSYALVYYKSGAMTWTYRGRWSYVIMGVSDGSRDNYQRNLYTKTERAYSIDAVSGSTGRFGTWLYKIGQVPVSPLVTCINWYLRNVANHLVRQAGFSQLPQCPCSHRDVWRKMRYFWVRSRTDTFLQIQCYRMNRASSNQHYPFGKECCYSLDSTQPLYYQQLITYVPDAGTALAYNPSYYHLRDSYETEDKQGHDSCCNVNLNFQYCLLYYFLRPVGDCRAEIPFRFFWLFGDPHIVTLDEREYTFNGWGEYTLATLTSLDSSFVLQGRTAPTVTDSGSAVNATVFTAFGAEENGTRVFVQLDPNTNNSLIIYAAETDYSLRFQQEGNDFLVDDDRFTLMRENDSLVVSFPSEITLAVSVGLRSLVLGVAMPEKFRNQTKGLLGNYNTIKTDEFVRPDGTVLSDSITDRQLHQQFGMAWAVTEANSVLRYGPREGPSDFAHPDFTPLFLDEVSASDRQAAENLCGASDRACIYDFLASGSQEFALRTKQIRQAALKDNADIKNVLPSLQVPENVTVTSQVATSFSVTAHDPGDTVTYKLVHDGNGALRINSETGEITATVNDQQPVDVQVYAIDSSDGQSVVYSIPLIVCSGCSDHGQCDFTRVQQEAGSVNFRHAVCDCYAGWTGANCSENFNACASSPCHPLQDCIDMTPAQQSNSGVEYTCTNCPPGYSSEGKANQCLDVDECADDALNQCQVTCNNTAGSYSCSCPDGYRLTGDLRSCADVNECAEKSHDCQQVCNNTEGGYTCLCHEGYSLDSSGRCVQSSNTQNICMNSGCSQGCKAVQDPATSAMMSQCFCYSGYDLDLSDNKTCVDHDECQDSVCAQQCSNIEGSFNCSCYSGFQLNSDQRTCSPCPSLQYGPQCAFTCVCSGRGLDCHSVKGCVCEEGWTGSQCQVDVDECEENPDVCGEGQVCTNTNGSYTCACQKGYAVNADGVCQDVDECSNAAVCGEEEVCSNVPGSYFCSCRPGYQRVSDTCVDIDECALNQDNCQQKCVNVGGTYNCECNYGYRLSSDRKTCSQVSDPCTEEENLSCDHGCTLDDSDTALCFCRKGYTLNSDKQTCDDIDECTESEGMCSHMCDNSMGGFTCSCPVGMKLDNDGKTCVSCPSGTYGANCSMTCSCGAGASHCDAVTGCVCKTGWTGNRCQNDVNECDVSSTRQECEGQGARCVNLQGGYRCQCAEGYKMNDDGVCTDIDECMRSPCSQSCENSAGSYRCLCNSGFSFNSITGECTDVDECAVSSTHSCSQQCDNTAGSYRCSCDVRGYVLSDDGVTCTATTKCSRRDCDETNGGCYFSDSNEELCFCNSGYSLESDGTTCTYQKTDWCTQGVCDDECTLSGDGMTFTCSCGDGYILNDDGRTCRACPKDTYGRDCQSNCTCHTDNTASCDTVDGSCTCKAGWQGDTCTDDVNECSQTTPCGSHATCSNTEGSYQCSCDVGYIKNSNGNCMQCSANTYGEGCSQICSCSGENVQSCDHVTGACLCKAGWEGVSCDKDRDECASDSLNDCSAALNMWCQNREGGYTCVCSEGFQQDSSGACVAASRLRFVVIIDVNIPFADLALEPSRSDIMQQLKTMILGKLRRFMTSLLTVDILSLRAGSVVADTDAVVSRAGLRTSASSLSTALLDMTGQTATISGHSGTIGVQVDTTTLTSNTTSCDVYTRYVACNTNEMCEMATNGPECRPKEEVRKTDAEDKGDGATLGLIIGLSVGIPLLIVIVCVVTAVCYRNKKRKPAPEPPRSVSNNVYNFSNQHPLDRNEGKINKGFSPAP